MSRATKPLHGLSSRSRARLCLAAMTLIALLPRAADAQAGIPADSNAVVEAYLESKGLKALLAEQLAARFKSVAGDERPALIEKLGKLYVELLASATGADREYWLQRAQELIHAAPDGQTFELRLNIARAQYAHAEDLAERWRLMLADLEQRGEAERQMRAVRAEFEKVGADLNRRVDFLERQDAPGRDPAKALEDLIESRRLRSIAFYYAGWAAYYQSLLSGTEAPANDALRSFGWLVGRGVTSSNREMPDLTRVPKGTFKYDHLARSAIGVAMCHSLLKADTEALRWLDAVEAEPELSAIVRESLLARRIVILAQANRFTDLRFAIDKARRTQDGQGVVALPTLSARLLAVLALQAQETSKESDIPGLAQLALGDLVARSEVGHVLDIAQRFGTAPLGDTGFIVHYVRGVQTYESAVDAHKKASKDIDEPPTDAAVVNAYRQSADLLDLAAKQADAVKFVQPLAKATVLAGRAFYHASQFGVSADRFLVARNLAENAKDAATAEEYLWLAIVALDKGSRTTHADAAQWGTRADELTALFLKTYPRSSRAPTLVLRRSESGGIKDDQAVKILLTVAKDDPVYEASRRQASRLLYRLFRAASTDEKAFAAGRFVPLGEEVMTIDKRLALGSEAKAATDATARLLTTARQLLDALLSVSSPDVARAQLVLDSVQSVVQFNSTSLVGIEDELAFRRFQIALVKGQRDQAQQIADSLAKWSATPSAGGKPSRFSVSAQRSLYLKAVEEWRRASKPVPPGMAGEPSVSDIAALHAGDVVKFGKRVIEQLTPSPTLLSEPGVATLHLNIAGAALDLFRKTGEREMLVISVELDRKVLTVQPANAEALRRLAQSAELAGDDAEALTCWRTLANGYEAGSPAFFEARYHAIRIQAKTDRPAAAEVILQHAVLYPSFGLEPWGEKLRALHAQLKDFAAPVSPNSGASGVGSP